MVALNKIPELLVEDPLALQICEKELIPCVWNSRQTPMYAVCIQLRLCPMLCCHDLSFEFSVNGCVPIFPVLWELSDVDKGHGNLHSLDYAVDYAHDLDIGAASPVTFLQHWGRFIVAPYAVWFVPISAPAYTCFSLLSIFWTVLTVKSSSPCRKIHCDRY